MLSLFQAGSGWEKSAWLAQRQPAQKDLELPFYTISANNSCLAFITRFLLSTAQSQVKEEKTR